MRPDRSQSRRSPRAKKAAGMDKQPYLLAILVEEGKTAGSQRIIVAEAGRGGQTERVCDRQMKVSSERARWFTMRY